MISQGWKSQKHSEAPAPLQVKRVNTQAARGGSWMDSMLGEGSSRTVAGAVGRFRRQAEAAEPSPAPQKAVMRMQALGSGNSPAPAKPKGYLRLVLVLLALAAGMAHFRPWQALSGLRLPKLVQVSGEAPETAQAAQVAVIAKPAEAKLPLVDAGGAPVALWRSESGQWYGVNSNACLSRMSDSDAASKLELPRLEAPGLGYQEKHGGRVAVLNVETAQLAELLPLRGDLAAEIDTVRVQGRDIKLVAHGGAVIDLGESDFKRKQAKLAAVLADLGARKKRAGSVDLRYDNTAVVRLAAR